MHVASLSSLIAPRPPNLKFPIQPRRDSRSAELDGERQSAAGGAPRGGVRPAEPWALWFQVTLDSTARRNALHNSDSPCFALQAPR
mmetsp:Transcript_29457/g.80368  ORF Transcript_29457/g.80368 Transcript_29457/m.80368 type:complete len:86 (-) Transcript_29457:1590-1847(-)